MAISKNPNVGPTMQVFRHLSILPVMFLALALPQRLIAVESLNALAFYRAIEEKGNTKIKNSASYDRLVVKDSLVESKYYIERRPTHSS
jgi:hypothetical protein